MSLYFNGLRFEGDERVFPRKAFCCVDVSSSRRNNVLHALPVANTVSGECVEININFLRRRLMFHMAHIRIYIYIFCGMFYLQGDI